MLTAACASSPTAPSPTASVSPASEGASQSSTTSEDGPSASPTGVPIGATRFVAVGDSITFGTLSSFDGVAVSTSCRAAGFGDPPSHAYPNVLQGSLNTFHSPQNFNVENCGVPGEGTHGAEGRIHALLSELRPQGLLLLEGINDLNGGAGVSSTVDNLRTIVEIAQLHNVTVFVGTMFQTYRTEQELPGGGVRVRENSAQLIPSFNSAIIQMAQGRQNVHIVDVYGRFGLNRSLVGNDGLHPTPEGYNALSVAFGLKIAEAFAVRVGFQ
jgi:lysophospholipase L1-like esterase